MIKRARVSLSVISVVVVLSVASWTLGLPKETGGLPQYFMTNHEPDAVYVDVAKNMKHGRNKGLWVSCHRRG